MVFEVIEGRRGFKPSTPGLDVKYRQLEAHQIAHDVGVVARGQEADLLPDISQVVLITQGNNLQGDITA